jgi:hypothetical protein
MINTKELLYNTNRKCQEENSISNHKEALNVKQLPVLEQVNDTETFTLQNN